MVWRTNEHLLPYPILVKLPEVVLRLAVIKTSKCGTLFAREIMVQGGFLERALEHHWMIACQRFYGRIIILLAVITEAVGKRREDEDPEDDN